MQNPCARNQGYKKIPTQKIWKKKSHEECLSSSWNHVPFMGTATQHYPHTYEIAGEVLLSNVTRWQNAALVLNLSYVNRWPDARIKLKHKVKQIQKMQIKTEEMMCFCLLLFRTFLVLWERTQLTTWSQ